MLELLQLKQKIEMQGYRDANSLFELRILLMDAATFLAKKHISNLRLKQDKEMSMLLLTAFSNIKGYYNRVGTDNDENCFLSVRELVLTDISQVLSFSFRNTSGYKIIPIQNTTSTASFGLAK
jgi:hypothetical protein